MVDLSACDRRLAALLDTCGSARAPQDGEPLYCGLDVGTAFIVLAVVDGQGEPVGCAYRFADVVRDGMVVDYIGACDIVRELKGELEAQLGCELLHTAAAIPPGTERLDGGAVRNVAESAGFEVSAVLDEPTAANLLVGLTDGAVVDIGGGTTGVSIVRDGRVLESVDESTGGTHLTLVLAGAKGLSFDEAEAYKRDPAHRAEVLPIVRPTVDKVASIVARAIAGHEVGEVVLVGGTAELAGIEARMEHQLGIPVRKPAHPMFATPLGIALGCLAAEGGADGGR